MTLTALGMYVLLYAHDGRPLKLGIRSVLVVICGCVSEQV